jgi:hypothetical protein
MRIGPALRLGWRLAARGGRPSLGRLALTSVGVGAAAFLMIAGAAVLGARQRHDERVARIMPIVVDAAEAPADRLEFGYGSTEYRGKTVGRIFVRTVGDSPPVPPGLDRAPGPGEIAASPALAALLASPQGELLSPRFPGRITQIIDPESLAAPAELFGYVGVRTAAELGPDTEAIAGFGGTPPVRALGETVQRPLFQVVSSVATGLLIPISVFVAVAARTAASAREARLAAIRLVGGTAGQTRVVVAIESLIASTAGCLVGAAVFLLARPALARLASIDIELRSEDLIPPIPWTMGIIFGVPALAVAVATVALRRVVLTPLGVVRRVGRTIRHGWRFATFVIGSVLLFTAWIGGDRLIGSDRKLLSYAIVFGGFGCMAIGAALLAPVVGTLAAGAVARFAPGPATLIGSRRLRADPRTSGRIVAGLAVVIFAVGVTHAFTIAYEEANHAAVPGGSLRSTTVLVDRWGDPLSRAESARLATIAGVTSVAPVWTAVIRREHEWLGDVAIAPCGALAEIVRRPPSCEGAPLFTGPDPAIAPGEPLTVRVHDPPGARRPAFEITPRSVVADPLDLGPYAQLFLPLEAIPPAIGDELGAPLILVGTDGRADTVERIRNAFPPAAGASVSTVPRWRRQFVDTVGPTVRAGVEAGTMLAFLVVAATILVAAVDGVGERRRSLACLMALGTPASVLRRALVIEIASPMLAAVGLAISSSMAATWLLTDGLGERMFVPWDPLARVSLYALVATALVTVGSFPSLGRAVDPSALTAE